MSNPRVIIRPGHTSPPVEALKLAWAATAYTRVGGTTHFNVSYDPSLGASGQMFCEALLATCERDYAALQSYFGGITPPLLPFNVSIDPGDSGASHGSCGDTVIHVQALDGDDPDTVRMLLIAEVAEVFMWAQGAGWDCGANNGEGLSRVLAADPYPAVLDGYATGSWWLDRARPDWVTRSERTDLDPVSTGCSTLFINYLRNQLGFTLTQVVGAGGSTLQETYITLTGSPEALDPFTWVLQSRFPIGTASGLGDDDPFPIADSYLPVPLDVLVHLQSIGDQSWHALQFAGTRGQSRRLEGFQIAFDPAGPGLTMQYMAHLEGIGDVPWVTEGQFVGTRRQSRRLEGFAIELQGEDAPNHYVTYMAHLEGIGDVPWVKDGTFCGTRGQSRSVEGISVKVAPKVLDVLVHLEAPIAGGGGGGDQSFYADETAGTRGQSRRLEGFQISFAPPIRFLGMEYMAHLQDIGDVPWVTEGQFVGTRGQARRLEGFAIKLTGANANGYDIWYMAHLQGTGDTQWFKNGDFCGTRGQSRRVEAIRVRLVPRKPSPNPPVGSQRAAAVSS